MRSHRFLDYKYGKIPISNLLICINNKYYNYTSMYIYGEIRYNSLAWTIIGTAGIKKPREVQKTVGAYIYSKLKYWNIEI